MIDELKHILGPKCTAVKVNCDFTEFINLPSKQMKLCEAVNHSFNIPIKINTENLGCPGARRCVGFNKSDAQLSRKIAGNNNISMQFISNALKTIPKICGVKNITFGMTEYMEKESQPDLFILYIQPVLITTIMHNLAKLGITASVPPYSLLSVCGNVFANCYNNNTVSISFGCPESRKHGGIKNNEVVLGLPYKNAMALVNVLI